MKSKKNRLFQILFLVTFSLLKSTCFADPEPPECEPEIIPTGCEPPGSCYFVSWESWSGVSCRNAIGREDFYCTWDTVCPDGSGGEWDSNNCTPSPSQQCDYNAPSCTTILTPSNWTNTDVIASVGTCSDNLSGCDWGTATTETITVHDESTSVTIKDRAGNETTCSVSPKSKIDKKHPYSTGNGTYMQTVGYPGGDTSQLLSDADEVSFAAHTQFIVLTDILDEAEGNSGRSGFVNDCNSWISIKGPNGEVSGSICAFSGISLQDTGTTAQIAIDGYFETAGHYSIGFQIYDQAENDSFPITKLLVHIVPGNADSILSSNLDISGYQKNGQAFVGSSNCNNLMADNIEACGFEILLKDKFGNIIGKEGPVLDPPDLPNCTFTFVPEEITPPDKPATADENEGEIELNWTCADTNVLTYVCDGEIGSSGFGNLTPGGGSETYEFTAEVETEEIINCTFTAKGGGGVRPFDASFKLLPECYHDNTMFPICLDAEITL